MSAARKLGRKQEAVIAFLLTERTHADAAVKAGISEATLQRWLRRPAFQAAYRSARRAVLDAALGQLQALAGEAVATLRECLSAQRPADRIKAAVAVLAHAKAGDVQELLAEVEALKHEEQAWADASTAYARTSTA